MSKARKRKKQPAQPLDGDLTALALIAPTLQAETLPAALTLQGASEGFEILADDGAGTDGKPKLKRFAMTAYTGVAMSLPNFGLPVVADLAGMQIPRQEVPILGYHDSQNIVGHSQKIEVSAQRLRVSGVISGIGDCAKEVQALAANGFPWQCSIGASVERLEFVDRGETVKVNGRSFSGPLYVARATTLKEVSFVPAGADSNTAATVTGQAKEGGNVKFNEWLTARGYDAAKLTEQEKNLLRAAFDYEQRQQPAPTPATPPVTSTATPPITATAPTSTTAPAPITATAPALDITAELNRARAEAAAEITRQNDLRRICAADPSLETEIEINGQRQRVSILAHATANNWTREQTELAVLRAERPRGPFVYSTSTPEVNESVLECAVLQAGRCQLFYDDFYAASYGERGVAVTDRDRNRIQGELRSRYPDQVQQAAHTLFKDRISLQQLLVASARTNGYRGSEVLRDDGDIQAVLRAQNWMIRADGSSTASLSNVLANVLNKFLLQGYFFTEQSWRDIAGIRPVKDFKPTKSVNLFGDFMYKDVGPAGELKHAALQDQAFANQASTTGRILSISRTHIINDDLGALTTVPTLMGRGAGLKLNDAFWTLFLNPGYDDGGSTNFFASTHTIANQSANSNYSSGGSTALASSAITAAVLLFDNQVDPMGKPLGIDAEILLYPPDLDTTARELMNAQFLVYGGGSASKQPNTNIWSGRFKPVKSRYLNKSAYTGYSTTAWYLLANPNIMPVIEACFLNGVDMPIVQTASPDYQFDILGISIRGVFDFGVGMQNFRGGVKMAGA